jgi:hypothetical protein
MDEARVGEVHGHGGVLLHQRAHRLDREIEAERKPERAPLDVLEHCIRCAGNRAQEVAALRDDRLAGDNRDGELAGHRDDGLVISITPVVSSVILSRAPEARQMALVRAEVAPTGRELPEPNDPRVIVAKPLASDGTQAVAEELGIGETRPLPKPLEQRGRLVVDSDMRSLAHRPSF